jgi:hypothetical protein
MNSKSKHQRIVNVCDQVSEILTQLADTLRIERIHTGQYETAHIMHDLDILKSLAEKEIQKPTTEIWTQDQVDSLNAFQQSDKFHPFTSPITNKDLVATIYGWVEKTNSSQIVQTWAHDFMLDWSWKHGNI